MKPLQKSVRHESKKLRDSARGQECTVRIPCVCNFDQATTVLAHLNGGGAGTKHSDLLGAFACSSCHSVLDGHTKNKEFTREQIELMHHQGVARTQQAWLDMGLVVLA